MVKNVTNSKSENIASVISIIYSASLSMTVFWLLIIAKGANKSINDLLNVHKGVGPLLSLFIISMISLIGGYFLLKSVLKAKQLSGKQLNVAVWVLIIATVVFTLMTAPPFFEPIVEIFA